MLVTNDLLKEYYTSVRTLYDYLLHSAPSAAEDNDLSHEDDTPEFRDMLLNSFVASMAGSCPNWEPPRSSVLCSMSEIIDRALGEFTAPNRRFNIMAAGYKASQSRDKHDNSRPGIANKYLNNVVTVLQDASWETLLQRVGVKVMYHLLTQTSIFMPLENDCLIQVTGDSILYARRQNPLKRPLQGEEDGPNKRAKREEPKKPSSSSNIHFHRTRLFYAKAIHSSDGIAAGLPPRHILNLLLEKRLERQGAPLEPDSHIHVKESQSLARHIFPREYHLPNVFSNPKLSFKAPFGKVIPAWMNEPSQKSLKTPRRLRDILPILEKLIHMHTKCGYKALLKVACPSKAKKLKQRNNEVVLGVLSGVSSLQSQQIPTTESTASSTSTPPAAGTDAKPRFVEIACSYSEVYRFVAVVVKCVIPKAFWGSEHNRKVVMESVKLFIESRKYEGMTLHQTLQGFRVMDCEWLMPPGRKMLKQTRVSVTDAQKRRQLLEEFLFWFFNDFLVQLLRTTFYITDTSTFRNKILYFRQSDWVELCTPLINKFSSSLFRKLESHDMQQISKHNRSVAQIRFLPKESGVRPITNLSNCYRGSSINSILRTAFGILNYEKKMQPERLGFSVFGIPDIYKRLKQYKSELLRQFGGHLPRLYFVKVDVQACFDTIDQDVLLRVLEQLLQRDCYATFEQTRVTAVRGDPLKRRYDVATDGDCALDFTKTAADMAAAVRGIIFVNQPREPQSREEVLKVIRDHLTENVVKIGSEYYKQVVGIPQGSIISTLLCAFFYGNMEASFNEKDFGQDSECRPTCLLIRQTDDYLLITPDLGGAKRFLAKMNKGHPEYGCFISRDKTVINFDYDEHLSQVLEPKVQAFPYSGLHINLENLSVAVDYSRYRGLNLQDTLSVDRCSHPGVNFRKKMLKLAAHRLEAIYFDPVLNSQECVMDNVYKHLCFMAMRMHGYLRHLPRLKNKRNSKDCRFLDETIFQIIRYVKVLLLRLWSKLRSEQEGRLVVMDGEMVTWLGIHAFNAVLSLKSPTDYLLCLRRLRHELKSPRYRNVLRDGCLGVQNESNRAGSVKQALNSALKDLRLSVTF